MKVYIGGDHRGYFLKEKIARWLLEWEYKYSDMGADSLKLGDDYTVYAERVASIVASENGSRGILLCGSGVGVDIIANKFDGVRSGIGLSKEQVVAAREDDDINILVIASEYTPEAEAKEMVKAFLETKYEKVARHERRIEDIKRVEENN
jgi:RpiB/LacA/LacB family sugar-phosphate isomerase